MWVRSTPVSIVRWRVKKKLQTLFILFHGWFAPLFTKEGERSTKLCSSFNLFSPKTKEKYLFDHCLFHSSGYNWGWDCRWGVRNEDGFLGSYSWVIAYQSIPLSRTGRGRLLAPMVSHVIFRITETLLTHMRNAEEVRGCIIKSVLMTSLYVHGFPWVHPWAKSLKTDSFWSISTEQFL